jgi:hypothetical protein
LAPGQFASLPRHPPAEAPAGPSRLTSAAVRSFSRKHSTPRGLLSGYTRRTLTAITPDGVTRVRITYRDKTRASFVPHDNVVIGHLVGPTPIKVRYER